jgi:hypothetical protein
MSAPPASEARKTDEEAASTAARRKASVPVNLSVFGRHPMELEHGLMRIKSTFLLECLWSELNDAFGLPRSNRSFPGGQNVTYWLGLGQKLQVETPVLAVTKPAHNLRVILGLTGLFRDRVRMPFLLTPSGSMWYVPLRATHQLFQGTYLEGHLAVPPTQQVRGSVLQVFDLVQVEGLPVRERRQTHRHVLLQRLLQLRTLKPLPRAPFGRIEALTFRDPWEAHGAQSGLKESDRLSLEFVCAAKARQCYSLPTRADHLFGSLLVLDGQAAEPIVEPEPVAMVSESKSASQPPAARAPRMQLFVWTPFLTLRARVVPGAQSDTLRLVLRGTPGFIEQTFDRTFRDACGQWPSSWPPLPHALQGMRGDRATSLVPSQQETPVLELAPCPCGAWHALFAVTHPLLMECVDTSSRHAILEKAMPLLSWQMHSLNQWRTALQQAEKNR